MRGKGYSYQEIGTALRHPKSVIWYEYQKRRSGKPYAAKEAKRIAYERMYRRRRIGKKIVSHKGLRTFVERHLFDDQSPEAIAGRIKQHEKELPNISASAIRRFIKSPYGRRIEAHRAKVLKRRKRKRVPRTNLAGKRMISERPKGIAMRHGLGHTEGDFIVSGTSGRGMVLGLVDRKVRKTSLEKIFPVSVVNIIRALRRIKKRFPELRSITFDNDILLIDHKRIEQTIGVKLYFTHPRSPWEKPSVEHMNKIQRRYIYKSSDISKYSRYRVRKLEERLNRRFMECLDYKTPDEVYVYEKTRRQKRRKST